MPNSTPPRHTLSERRGAIVLAAILIIFCAVILYHTDIFLPSNPSPTATQTPTQPELTAAEADSILRSHHRRTDTSATRKKKKAPQHKAPAPPSRNHLDEPISSSTHHTPICN